MAFAPSAGARLESTRVSVPVLSQSTADALAAGLMSMFGVAFTHSVREFEV